VIVAEMQLPTWVMANLFALCGTLYAEEATRDEVVAKLTARIAKDAPGLGDVEAREYAECFADHASCQPAVSWESAEGHMAALPPEITAAGLKPPPRPLFLTDAELAVLPPVEWDIDGILPTSGLSYLIGLPGSGKSLLALDWSCSVALGRPWLRRAVNRGPALYVAAEGARSLHSRLECWKFYHKHPMEVESGVEWFPRRLALRDAQSVGAFIAAAATHRPRVVIIDTLARCTQGTRENDPDGMGEALGAADRIRETLGAGVLLLAHPAREGGDTPRGHSSQDGAADAIWILKEQDGARTLTCGKLKDGDESPVFSLVLSPVGSGVLLLPASEAGVQSSLTPGQRAVLATIRGTDTGTGVTAATISDASKVAKSSVHFVLKNLLDLRYVTVRKHRWFITPLGLVQLSSGESS
jgi:hypothetical protein